MPRSGRTTIACTAAGHFPRGGSRCRRATPSSRARSYGLRKPGPSARRKTIFCLPFVRLCAWNTSVCAPGAVGTRARSTGFGRRSGRVGFLKLSRLAAAAILVLTALIVWFALRTREGAVSALVTNPVQKKVLQDGGFRHPGHTEYLAELGGSAGKPASVVMMLACSELRVVPVTIHVPLVPAR